MKLPIFTEIENEEDIDLYFSREDDAVIEAGFKGLALFVVIAGIVAIVMAAYIYFS